MLIITNYIVRYVDKFQIFYVLLNYTRDDLLVYPPKLSIVDLDRGNLISDNLGKTVPHEKKSVGRGCMKTGRAEGIKKRDPVLPGDLHKRSEIRTTLGNPNYIKSTPIRISRRAGEQVFNYECLRYPTRATGF